MGNSSSQSAESIRNRLASVSATLDLTNSTHSVPGGILNKKRKPPSYTIAHDNIGKWKAESENQFVSSPLFDLEEANRLSSSTR
jgi:hypothetical protein